jgi:hypothetical protein
MKSGVQSISRGRFGRTLAVGILLVVAWSAGAAPAVADKGLAPVKTAAHAAAERALLYDEDPANPTGRSYEGTVVWRTERVGAHGADKGSVAVRADLEIPARKLKLVLTLRRNRDPELPASHVAELAFTVAKDFSDIGISKVAGMLMKSEEPKRGMPIAGLSVKVTDGVFMIGFSNVDPDRARNIQLLKEREWFDVPLVYENRHRGILTIAKGVSGQRVFDEAFAAWEAEP